MKRHEFLREQPESVPERTAAVEPGDFLGAGLRKPLVTARNRGTGRAGGREPLRRAPAPCSVSR